MSLTSGKCKVMFVYTCEFKNNDFGNEYVVLQTAILASLLNEAYKV